MWSKERHQIAISPDCTLGGGQGLETDRHGRGPAQRPAFRRHSHASGARLSRSGRLHMLLRSDFVLTQTANPECQACLMSKPYTTRFGTTNRKSYRGGIGSSPMARDGLRQRRRLRYKALAQGDPRSRWRGGYIIAKTLIGLTLRTVDKKSCRDGYRGHCDLQKLERLGQRHGGADLGCNSGLAAKHSLYLLQKPIPILSGGQITWVAPLSPPGFAPAFFRRPDL